VTVRDQGGWRPPAEERVDRRLGVPLMRALMDSVTINGTPTGSTVVLLSRPEPT